MKKEKILKKKELIKPEVRTSEEPEKKEDENPMPEGPGIK